MLFLIFFSYLSYHHYYYCNITITSFLIYISITIILYSYCKRVGVNSLSAVWSPRESYWCVSAPWTAPALRFAPPPLHPSTHLEGFPCPRCHWVYKCVKTGPSVIYQKLGERMNRSGRGDRSAAFFWMELLHPPPPTHTRTHARLPSVPSPDWSSPAIADVSRALLWMSPRAWASILPPIDAEEENKKSTRCQVRVRCSFDADSKGGQPGLFCLLNREFSSITSGAITSISINWITEKRRIPCVDKFTKSPFKGKIDATVNIRAWIRRVCLFVCGGASSVWCNGAAAGLHNRELHTGGWVGYTSTPRRDRDERTLARCYNSFKKDIPEFCVHVLHKPHQVLLKMSVDKRKTKSVTKIITI